MGTGGVDKKNDKSILYSLVKKKVLEKVFCVHSFLQNVFVDLFNFSIFRNKIFPPIVPPCFSDLFFASLY